MPTIKIVWADNTRELASHLREGLDQIEATRAAAEKLARSLGGENLIRAAHNYVAALEQIGGKGGALAAVERQTNAERQRTIDILQRAIAKYELLGKEAPAAMREVLAAAQAAQRPATQMAEQAAQWQQATKSLQQFGGAARAVGTGLTAAITVPLVGMGSAAAKFAIDFESSFAGVRKTVDATEPQFAQMSQAFRDLAKTIPINVNELNRLGEAAGALGVPQAEVVEFSRVMAELGVTTNVTSDQAAESVAQIQNIFGAAGKDTERFASTLVDLGNKGASTEAQILELTKRLAGAGHTIGLSQAQVLGFASAIANVGIEAEAGGSAMSRVFTDLAIVVSKGGSKLEEFARIAGMSGDAFAKLFRADAAQATTAFIEGLGRIQKSGGDLIGTLEQLGFTELRQADLLKRLAGSGDNLAASLKVAGKAWADNSALTEEARKRFETTASQLAVLWNRVKDVGITIGNALLPGIKALVAAADTMVPIFERAAKVFAALPGPVQALVIGTAALAAALGPVLIILGQVAISASALTTAFAAEGLASKALAVSTTTLRAVYQALLTPITLASVATAEMTVAQTVASAASKALAASLALVRGALALIVAHPLVALVAAVGAAVVAYSQYKQSVAEAALATQTQAAKQDVVNLAIQRGARGLQEITDFEQRYTKAIQFNTEWLKKKNDAFEQYMDRQRELQGRGASAAEQVTALSDALVKAGQQGKLGPEQLKRFAEQAVALQRAGGDLTPALQNAVRAMEMMGRAAAGPQATFDGLRKMVEATQKEITNLDPAIRQQLVAAIQQGVISVKDMAESAGISERAVELLKKQLEGATKSTSKWAEANRDLTAMVDGLNWDGTVEGALKLGVSVETVATYFGMARGEVKRISDDLELFGRISKDVADESTDAWKKWVEEQEKIADLRDQAFVKNNEIFVESSRRAADEAAKASLTSFEYQRRQILEWQDTAEGAIDYTEENWIDAYAAIAKEAQQKLDAVRDAEEAESIRLKFEFVGPTSGGPAIGPSTFDKLKASLGAALGGFPDLMVQALTGGGGVFGALTGFASQMGGILTKSLGSTLMSSIGGLLGKVVGGIVGPLGALLGPVLDKIFGFFHKTEAQKLAHDVGRDWGMQISDGLAKQMEADSKKFGRQAAELLHLKDIFAEAGGINAGNVDAATRHLRDVFSLIETHQLTIAQGAKVIDENWQDLVAAGTDSFGFISDQLREIIDLDDIFGTKSKEIAAFLKSQADIAVKGSNAAINSIEKQINEWDDLAKQINEAKKSGGDYSALLKRQTDLAAANSDQLEDLGTIALSTFSAAIAAGATFAEALEQAQPGLQRLADAFRDLGIETDDAALKALLYQSQILKNNPALLQGVSSLGQAFAALSNMGLLNVDTFRAMERTGLQMYTRLQAETAAVGGTTRDALLPMQDYLHKAAEAAKELGIPLDDTTQILIDQSKELGIWKEAGKSATEKLIGGMQTLVDKVSELIDKLLGIPHQVNTDINVTTKYSTEGASPSDTPDYSTDFTPRSYEPYPVSRGGMVTNEGVQYFARGKMPARVLQFKPIGTDVIPAMLSPREMVLTPSQQQVVGSLVSQATGSGGAAPGDAPASPSTVFDMRGAFVADGPSFRRMVSQHWKEAVFLDEAGERRTIKRAAGVD